MSKILITGGAGFIGSNLAIKLLDKGHHVRVLDNLSPQIHGDNPDTTSPLYASIRDKVEFIKGTVTSREDWVRVIKDQDIIVHFAAETGTGQSMYQVHRYVDVNVGGTALMLDVLANEYHGVKKIVLASSRAVYGEGPYLCAEHGVVYPEIRKEQEMAIGEFDCKCPVCAKKVKLLPTKEEDISRPTSVYGITKLNQEQMVMLVGRSIGIPVVVFRYQNVYGPGQSLSNPYTGILSIFSTQIKNGNDINIFEDGQESRDFVYIDDVIQATVSGIEMKEANFQIFNVGTGVPISVLTIANNLKQNYGSNIRIVNSKDYRVGDIRHNYADLSKTSAVLRYKPRVTIKDGLYKFCLWVDKQAVQNDMFQDSIDEMKRKGVFKSIKPGNV